MSVRTYKYRIYPNENQEILINKTIGCARLIFNKILADNIEQYKKNKEVTQKTHTAFKEEYPFLSEVDSFALTTAYNNVKTAYKNFFNGIKNGRKVGFPKFKSKHKSAQTYTTYNNAGQIRIEKKGLKLPKVGFVKVVWHRFCKGKIKHVTISKTKTGKYFASICCEVSERKIKVKQEEKILGIDMSFKELAVYSSGEKANYPKFYRNSLRKLTHAQKIFSKTKVGSVRHEKARLKVARIYEKITNQRKDFLDKESCKIAENWNVVVVEDLNMRSMANRGMKNGKTVNDIGFGLFRQMLEYKLERRSGKLVKADKFFASSQLCSNCGFKNIEVKNLAIREWTCPNCNETHDRDINAAKNLVKFYLNQNTVATTEINARGENVSLESESSLLSSLEESRKVVGLERVS